MNIKISNRVGKIIKTYTPREKAIVMVQDFMEPTQLRLKPRITTDEARSIVTLLSPEEGEEYNKWVRFYYVYAELTPTICLTIDQYATVANRAASYIFLRDSYKQEENHLNEIFLSLKDAGNEEALRGFGESLSRLHFKHGAKITRDKDGFVEVDTEELSDLIAGFAGNIKTTSSLMKALLVALDEWTEKTKSADLMPSILSTQIDRTKKNRLIDVGPSYYARALLGRISRGYAVTEEEIKVAILPYYEEMSVDERFLEDCRKKIKGIDEQIKL